MTSVPGPAVSGVTAASGVAIAAVPPRTTWIAGPSSVRYEALPASTTTISVPGCGWVGIAEPGSMIRRYTARAAGSPGSSTGAICVTGTMATPGGSPPASSSAAGVASWAKAATEPARPRVTSVPSSRTNRCMILSSFVSLTTGAAMNWARTD